jgi:hypothetical protein
MHLIFTEATARLDSMKEMVESVKNELAGVKEGLAAGGLSEEEEKAIRDRIEAVETALQDAASSS